MQGKLDILEHLDRQGDINDPVFLREELQRISFLLDHERMESDRRTIKVHQLLENQEKIQNDSQILTAQVKDLTERLNYAQEQLYDIKSNNSESDDESK